MMKPDAEAMRAHLEHLFGGWLDEYQDGLVELAWADAKDGKLRHSRLFETDCLDDLAETAARVNAVAGQNVYIGAALRKHGTPRNRRAADASFYALTAFYVDLDEAGAYNRALTLTRDVRPTAVGVTGKHPHTRAQLWWRQETPVADPDLCRRQNRALADAMGGDTTVTNPSRVMRLAGSIAWPKKPGRVVERTDFSVRPDGSPYPEGRVARFFSPAEKPAPPSNHPTAPRRRHSIDPSRPSPDAETLLGQVGPGNWHAPMLRAVARFVAAGWSDEDILAKAEPYTLSGWTTEQTRGEVSAMIAGARRKGFARQRLSPWKLVDGVPPAYLSKPLARDEASAQLRSCISQWFDQTQALALARRELARRYKSRFARRTPREIADAWRAEVKEKYGIADLRAAPRLAVQAVAGIGKTEAVVQEIVSRPKLRDLHISIFVPTLDLGERLAQRIVELSFDPRFAPGPEVRVMRGRLAEATEERGPREPKTMCRKPDAADLASRLGLNVFKTLCRSGAGTCEHYDHCPWIKQWNDRGPAVRIWSHQYLHLPMPSGFPAANMVIVDESVVETLAGELAFAPDRLAETPSWAEGESADCLDRVRKALSEDKPLLEAARAQGLDGEILARAAEAAEGREDGDTGVTPDMPEGEAVERLAALEESERKKIALLLRQLANEVALKRPGSHAVELRRNDAVTVNGKTERQNRIFVRWRQKVLAGKYKPLLLIDADADGEINRRLFGEPLEHVAISVSRNAVVTQCHSSSFSRRSLIGFPGAPPKLAAQAAKRIAQIKSLIEKLARSARLFVICAKPVRRAITGERDEKLPLCCEWKGATIAHFGRVRGVDDWKHHEAVLMIGREQPRARDIEGLARAIWDDDPEPLSLPGEYVETLRGYRIKNGNKAGARVHTHPDPRVQRVLELKRERESVQAVDRIRLVYTNTAKEVYILSKLPLDWMWTGSRALEISWSAARSAGSARRTCAARARCPWSPGFWPIDGPIYSPPPRPQNTKSTGKYI